jgi:hypothetical protein
MPLRGLVPPSGLNQLTFPAPSAEQPQENGAPFKSAMKAEGRTPTPVREDVGDDAPATGEDMPTPSEEQ